VNGHEHDPLTEAATPVAHTAAPPSPAHPAGLRAAAGTMGNRAFATAVLSRRPVLARQGPGHDEPPPLPPQVRAVAETKIAPELQAVATELRATPPPTVEHLRRMRVRVAAVRELFDTVRPPAGVVADNWEDARSSTAIGRTLIDGLLFPESDAMLRLGWGKALGTCRQLVGILREAASQAPKPAPDPGPAPSPNPLPPPPPPPIGTQPPPAPALSPDAAMEFEVCPRIEAAIAEIPHMLAAETVAEITAVYDRFLDVPNQIIAVAGGQEFGPVAAVEFEKGLELVRQATLPPPEQLIQIAELLERAVAIADNLETPGAGNAGGAQPAPVPAPTPSGTPGFAPSPNPLPPPPPPPPVQ
jgi:hypothetical protein